MANGPPSIQAPPSKMPVVYHLSGKEDISIESLRGHYHGVSTCQMVMPIGSNAAWCHCFPYFFLTPDSSNKAVVWSTLEGLA